MKLYDSLDEVPADFGPSAVTIGKFDGVHSGHRAVIAELRAMAEADGLVPTVVTFDRHPLALINPGLAPERLISNAQKAERLEAAGVQATLSLPFDEAFAAQSPDEFVERVLVNALKARIVFVGSDFRYGHRGEGNVAGLIEEGRRFGFEVRLVDDVRTREGRRASSTWIREALAQGRVEEAAEVLGTPATVRSIVVPGEKRGRELGFPTANLRPNPEGLIPADGVYAGWLTVDGVTYPAAISIGNNPTFEGVPARQVEAYVLDEDIDLYGRTVELAFVKYLRGMEKYDSIEALVAALRKDVDDTRAALGMPPQP
ncbi:bifunctional riboflavin kinase/FAD synthetase [Homoserinimonas hongtaonis]|uniref:Riboflavin biosynthesis protein n=1 Tax=Homoserinimonas hongtaonis TaxID=2079791 RepID=A0A2U1SXQ1_9MICO|nr:bifunctional riboflavin kinase/FAD synthetase [Salinibacterium hongtaonis]AWB90536.1 bifunctional riboflavin kinase/FAD synthetase [Salinibacterium hongtaonis]PWB96389.1 bifunctional riboflavin kinase/FAD synthetase [Salinibacterium hongtaonis]